MWHASRGLRGECPPHYRLIRAAKYLGVPPWELAVMPMWWMEWAIEFEQAEVFGEIEFAKRTRQQSVGSSRIQ